MDDLFGTSDAIVTACLDVRTIAPREVPPDLPPDPDINGQPGWYQFERNAWELGEKVRQSLQRVPKLKRDLAVLDAILGVISYRQLRRGRQSFVMALGFSAAASCSPRLVPWLDDPDIDGHVLHTLLKMRVSDYVDRVRPFVGSEYAWIRNLAKRYLSKYAPAL